MGAGIAGCFFIGNEGVPLRVYRGPEFPDSYQEPRVWDEGLGFGSVLVAVETIHYAWKCHVSAATLSARGACTCVPRR